VLLLSARLTTDSNYVRNVGSPVLTGTKKAAAEAAAMNFGLL